jgi:hypothetical protein
MPSYACSYLVDHACIQLARLEKEMKERSKKDGQKEQKLAEAPIINLGFGGPI